MKKAISLLLALVICLSLCACGNNNVDSKVEGYAETEAEPSNEATKNNDLIEFEEPVLVWEDDNVKIELVSFYQELLNWYDKGPVLEKGITVRYYNKTNYGVIIQLQEAYLGVDAVQIMHTNGSESPAAGKATTYNYMIQHITGSSTSALESMDDLYQLDGKFWVGIKHDPSSNMVNESYDVNFSLPSIMSGESVETPEAEIIEELAMGETASTEFAKFTLTEIEYAERLNTSTGSGILTRDHGLTDAGLVVGNNIFAILRYDFTNMAKESASVIDVVTVTVDYNNGYLYSTDDGLAYTFDSTGFYNNYSGDGYSLELAPLEADNFKVCIPVAPVVGEDEVSPLQIIVTLQGAGGSETFKYIIR